MQPPQFTPPPAGSYGHGPRPPPAASGEAVAALVCGIGAWFCFPVGFVALYLGARARRAARDNPGVVGGEQMALVGMILGGVLGGIQLLAVLLYVVFFGIAFGLAATGGP